MNGPATAQASATRPGDRWALFVATGDPSIPPRVCLWRSSPAIFVPVIKYKHQRSIPPGRGSWRYGRGWKQAVRRQLIRQPSCEACGSLRRVTVHHIIPPAIAPALVISPGNLMTLCRGSRHAPGCHLVIGHLGNWRSWNPLAREDAAARRSASR